MLPSNGYVYDAQGATKLLVEIIKRGKPKLWKFSSLEEETTYCAWLGRWAAHWGYKALDYNDKVLG